MEEDKSKKVLVPFADGMEEMEAISIVDILRRAGLSVLTVSIADTLEVKASRGTKHLADDLLKNIDPSGFDMIVLPGGGTGTENLSNCLPVISILKNFKETGKMIGAICAAPSILLKEGIIEIGDSFTGFPGSVPEVKGYEKSPFVINGKIITGLGPGFAIEFSLEIVKALLGYEKYSQVKKGLLL